MSLHWTYYFLQGCCKFCDNKLSNLKQILMGTVSEVKTFKRQIKKLKHASNNGEQPPETEMLMLEKECRELISNSTSMYNTVSLFMRRLFTEAEILSLSVSVKVSNSKSVARPKFDTPNAELLKSLVMELHKEVTVSQITKILNLSQGLNLILPMQSC